MGRLAYLRNPRLLGALVLVAVILGIAMRPSPVSVDVATAVRGELVVTVDEEGESRVRDRFVVVAPAAGDLERVELEPGDAVEAGRTRLARILPAAPVPLDARSRAEAEASVEAARAVVGAANAELERADGVRELALSELSRHEKLAAEKVVSAQLLETRRIEARSAARAADSARFAVADAEQRLAVARARLVERGSPPGAMDVLAPVGGVVLRRHRESAGVVAPGAPLLEIGDPASLEVVCDLLTSEAVKVAPGAAVVLEDWGGAPLAGRVRRIEPSAFTKVSALGVEEQRVNVLVDLDAPPEGLGDGYRLEVRIVVWEGKDVLQLPSGCLFRRGDAWAVFLVKEGRAAVRTVEIGSQNGRVAEVRSGLEEGDRVVLHPADTLAEGARVVARAAS